MYKNAWLISNKKIKWHYKFALALRAQAYANRFGYLFPLVPPSLGRAVKRDNKDKSSLVWDAKRNRFKYIVKLD